MHESTSGIKSKNSQSGRYPSKIIPEDYAKPTTDLRISLNNSSYMKAAKTQTNVPTIKGDIYKGKQSAGGGRMLLGSNLMNLLKGGSINANESIEQRRGFNSKRSSQPVSLLHSSGDEIII